MIAGTAEPLTLEEVTTKVGRSRQQVWKWIRKGLKPAGGPRIKLKARKLGQTWFIDPADLDEFSRRLTEAALAKPEATP